MRKMLIIRVYVILSAFYLLAIGVLAYMPLLDGNEAGFSFSVLLSDIEAAPLPMLYAIVFPVSIGVVISVVWVALFSKEMGDTYYRACALILFILAALSVGGIFTTGLPMLFLSLFPLGYAFWQIHLEKSAGNVSS